MDPPFALSLALSAQVGLKVEVLSYCLREIRTGVESVAFIDPTVVTHRFKSHHQIDVGIDEEQIDTIEATASQLRQQHKLVWTHGAPPRDNSQIHVAACPCPAFRLRPEKVNSLHLRETGKQASNRRKVEHVQ
jgi:hypothetical protein